MVLTWIELMFLTFRSVSDAFIKNPDDTEYVGQVWPGYTVFPDWFSENTQEYWTEALKNWSSLGIEFSGIWLDMNEASSFCNGSWYALFPSPQPRNLIFRLVALARTCQMLSTRSLFRAHLGTSYWIILKGEWR